MRTVTFRSVLHGTARMAGLDPATGELSPETAARLGEFISSRLREAWEFDFFAETMLLEQRAFRDEWDAAATYAVGKEVYYAVDGLYYECLVENAGEIPATATSFWALVETLDPYIEYAQPGKTPIGHVACVSVRNPRTSRNALRLNFSFSEKGVQVLDPLRPALVWIEFRRQAPEFTAEEWDSGTNYATGDVRYLPETGECYRALQAGTNQNPATQTDYWVKVDFPFVFSKYVKQAAYADWLDQDGQPEKAVAVRGEQANPTPGTAWFELMRLQDVEMGQQGQFGKVSVEAY